MSISKSFKLTKRTDLISRDPIILRKAVRAVGTYSLVYGWIKVILVFPVLLTIVNISRKYGINFDPGLPETITGAIADGLFTIVTAVPMIIYGGRIRSKIDFKTVSYLKRLILIAIILFIWDLFITFLLVSRMHHYVYLFIYIVILFRGLKSLKLLNTIENDTIVKAYAN